MTHHIDMVAQSNGTRTFRIFGQTEGIYTDLVVPAENFKERNVELIQKQVNFAVLDSHVGPHVRKIKRKKRVR